MPRASSARSCWSRGPDQDQDAGAHHHAATAPGRRRRAGRPHLTLVEPRESAPPATQEDENELIPSGRKEVRILGKIHVHGVPVIERRKSLELIVYLALHPQGADAEQVWEALWPERPLVRGTLHTTVSTARARLGEVQEGVPYLPDARRRKFPLGVP